MTMRISQLAREAGVNLQTIRYYERRGLLAPPARTPSGYRDYPADTAARLGFIKQAQALGFTLHEIAELLRLRAGDDPACAEIEQAARAKIALIDGKLRELGRLKVTLEELAEACRARAPAAECPILHALGEPVHD